MPPVIWEQIQARPLSVFKHRRLVCTDIFVLQLCPKLRGYFLGAFERDLMGQPQHEGGQESPRDVEVVGVIVHVVHVADRPRHEGVGVVRGRRPDIEGVAPGSIAFQRVLDGLAGGGLVGPVKVF